MEANAAPERALIQSALRRQSHTQEEQSHQQAHHGPDPQVETGMHKAEDGSLCRHCPPGANQMVEFAPQPPAKEQLLG